MSYTLILSEKREAAERIAKALDDNGRPSRFKEQGIPYFEAYNAGKRLLVVPAIGHLYTIAPDVQGQFNSPVFNVRWTASFLFNKKAMYTKRWITAISKISKGASKFICATDYDIEGEVIGYTILKYACFGKESEAKRMVFSTLTTKELRKSYMNTAQGINFKLVEAGETRHIIDFLWGINLSRALTLAVRNFGKFYKSLSTGRVQTPTLKFLADRKKEIQSFVPISYWKISSKVKIGNRFYDVEYRKSRIKSELDALKIIEKCSNSRAFVRDINIRTTEQDPPIPFDLGTLQRESYKLFKYSPKVTLQTAERLYLASLISYPRTSSQKIPPSINYREILSSLGCNNNYRELTNKLLTKNELKPIEGNKHDPAHPAIYPTGNLPKRRLNLVNKNVLDLIIKRFMATFAAPAINQRIKVSLETSGETFYLYGIKTLYKGWLEFYEPYERSNEIILPSLNIGDEVVLTKIRCEKKYTSPPQRYTPGSLLQLMEEQKIGTKATRADIINTLYNRGYIVNERISVTELGFKIIEILEKYCQEITSIEFTRTLEERMNNIERGLERKKNVLEESVNKLKEILTKISMNAEQIGFELSDAVGKRIQMDQ